MKTNLIVLLILVVLIVALVCLAGSFPFLSQPSFLNPPSSSVNPASISPYSQQNIVIIHVNNLEYPKPELVSIWFIFLKISDQTSATALLVYPPNTAAPNAKALSDTFSIGRDGTVAQSFWEALSPYKVNITGYILADDLAVDKLGKYLTGKEVSSSTTLVSQPALDARRKLLQSICENLDKGTPKGFPWYELNGIHLRTNLSFEALTSAWSRLNYSTQSNRCKMLNPIPPSIK